MFPNIWTFLLYIIKFASLFGFTIIQCVFADENDTNFNLYWFKVLMVLNIGEAVIFDILYYTHSTHKLPITNKDELRLQIQMIDFIRMLIGTVLCVMFFFVSFDKMEQYYPLLIVYNFWQGWFEGHHLTDYQTSFSHNILSVVVLLITTKRYKLLFWVFSRSMPISFNIFKYMLYFLTSHKTVGTQF